MRIVQNALAGLGPGIPVIAGVWRNEDALLPQTAQYVTYTVKTAEAGAADDRITGYRTEVYLNLWSETDPTETAEQITEMMYAAGFGLESMDDGTENKNAYEASIRKYRINMKWVMESPTIMI